MSASDDSAPLLCPSSQADWPNAVAIGVVGGTATKPIVHYLEDPVIVSDELLTLAEPVRPTEVFRFAAPCIDNHCRHFGEQRCQLASKIVTMLPAEINELPRCHIRSHCRWFNQEGRDACARCPLVATHDANRSAALRSAANPESVTFRPPTLG